MLTDALVAESLKRGKEAARARADIRPRIGNQHAAGFARKHENSRPTPVPAARAATNRGE